MITVGLVGCGFMGKMHSSVYSLLEESQLAMVADLDLARAKAFSSEFGCKIATFDEMLGDASLDVIDICLPTHLHCEFTVRALEAGKHVMCEKPAALTLDEADRMIAARDASGKSLMIGHCIRFWPEYALLRRYVVENKLGRLLSLNLTRYGEFPHWSSENWLADESKSGGGVLDMHIHDTDFALYLLGKPDSISAWGSVDDRGPGHAFSTLTYGDTIVHTEGGWNLPSHAPFKMAYRAIFERGAMIMDAGPLTVFEPGKEPVIPEFPKMEAAGGGNISDLGGYYHELRYFVESIQSGAPPKIVTAESSRDSLELTLEEIRQIKSR
jgi:predicted dehydrogenase